MECLWLARCRSALQKGPQVLLSVWAVTTELGSLLSWARLPRPSCYILFDWEVQRRWGALSLPAPPYPFLLSGGQGRMTGPEPWCAVPGEGLWPRPWCAPAWLWGNHEPQSQGEGGGEG